VALLDDATVGFFDILCKVLKNVYILKHFFSSSFSAKTLTFVKICDTITLILLK